MKAIISSICIGSLALALTAYGEKNDWHGNGKAKGKASTVSVQKATANSSVRSLNTVNRGNARSFSAARLQQPNYTTNQNIVRNNSTNVNKARVFAEKKQDFRTTNNVQTSNNLAIKRDRNFNLNRERNFSVQRDQNITMNRDRAFTGNHNFAINRNRNVAITNNWSGQQFSGQNYSAFRNYHREWHDRNWWSRNHSRITFYFGAPYYWDTGYWYPAWGYYPDYVYEYDGPIYGYNNLAPDQVILNVQAQLQRDGYYNGPIDGVIGPMTRSAVAQFQADHGLAITSAIDQPTLSTLGLT
jgi:hypothetical protein